MKLFVIFCVVAILSCACAHSKPAPQDEGRALDDATLQKYRVDAHGEGAVKSGQVVRIGNGESDLSGWKSSEERAKEAEAAQAAGNATTDAMATTPSPSSGSDAGMAAAPEDIPDVADVIPDDAGDAGRTVEADDVELTPPDE